jgi:HlyD family secretion protein
VLASIDEADVGPVREGLEARFTVDAFPGDGFTGRISQVRLNAQAVQNVVTYTAVVDVANTDGKLRPGMTANLTIPTASRANVLAVPNAALRFKPTLTDEQQRELKSQIEARRQEISATGADASAGDRKPGQAVWVLVDGKRLERRSIQAGLSDGHATEVVSGDLREGDVVVIGQNGGSSTAGQQQRSGSPLGPRPGGGFTGGRTSGGGR